MLETAFFHNINKGNHNQAQIYIFSDKCLSNFMKNNSTSNPKEKGYLFFINPTNQKYKLNLSNISSKNTYDFLNCLRFKDGAL